MRSGIFSHRWYLLQLALGRGPSHSVLETVDAQEQEARIMADIRALYEGRAAR